MCISTGPHDVDRTLTRSAVLNGLTPSLSLLTTSQHGATLRLVILDSGRRAQDTAPGIDTGVLQQRYFLHDLALACSPPPPPRPQISHTILTQAECCASRAAALCELGLFPVVKTTGPGTRVFWQ